MSIKIKIPEESIWTKPRDPSYTYPINISDDFTWPTQTLKMAIHPEWLKLMDILEVGDVVTTHESHVGVITKVFEITPLGMKKYEVLIGNKKEIFFSMSLKKIEDKNE